MAARPGHGCTVVQVGGDLDMATTPGLRDTLHRVVDAGDRQVVVDLGEVGFLDSSGLGALVTAFRALDEAGGRLSLAAPQPAVVTVLRITSVDQVIDIYETVEAAEATMPGA